MCWNKDVSVASFLFGAASAVYAAMRDTVEPRLLVFYMIFTTIQLMEYFLWKHFDEPERNRFWSRMCLMVLTLIPVGATLAIRDPAVRAVAFGASVVYFAYVVHSVYDRIDFRTTTGLDGHLQYQFIPPTPLYSVGWFVFFFLGVFLSGHAYLQTFATITCMTSLGVVKQGGSFNSFWCFTAVGIWAVVLSSGNLKI